MKKGDRVPDINGGNGFDADLFDELMARLEEQMDTKEAAYMAGKFVGGVLVIAVALGRIADLLEIWTEHNFPGAFEDEPAAKP